MIILYSPNYTVWEFNVLTAHSVQGTKPITSGTISMSSDGAIVSKSLSYEQGWKKSR